MLDLADVKAWLQITDEDEDRDARLEGLMLRAEEAVQRELDWYFGQPRATTEVLNGSGFPAIWLRQPPANGLTVSSRTGPTNDWTELDADDWEQDGRGVWHAQGVWIPGVRNYRFAYQEGFTVPPGDVVQFTLDLISSKWARTAGGTTDDPFLTGEKIGRYSYTRAAPGAGITLGDMALLAGWPNVVANWRRGRI